MVDSKEFKEKIESITSQEYKLEFLGDNFDEIVSQLSEIKSEKIYDWIEKVLNKNIQPILINTKKPYKEWKVNQLLTFRYPFNINNIEYRILFVKVKNALYIEFHLGNHKYYDKVRKN
jgi:hypothetical protein